MQQTGEIIGNWKWQVWNGLEDFGLDKAAALKKGEPQPGGSRLSFPPNNVVLSSADRAWQNLPALRRIAAHVKTTVSAITFVSPSPRVRDTTFPTRSR